MTGIITLFVTLMITHLMPNWSSFSCHLVDHSLGATLVKKTFLCHAGDHPFGNHPFRDTLVITLLVSHWQYPIGRSPFFGATLVKPHLVITLLVPCWWYPIWWSPIWCHIGDHPSGATLVITHLMPHWWSLFGDRPFGATLVTSHLMPQWWLYLLGSTLTHSKFNVVVLPTNNAVKLIGIKYYTSQYTTSALSQWYQKQTLPMGKV